MTIVERASSGFMGYLEPERRPRRETSEDLRGELRENPTEAELSCLIEMTNRNEHAAAAACGMSLQTVKNHLSKLYTRIGARSRAQAVAICWPIIGDELVPTVPTPAHPPFVERRLGLERRAPSAPAVAIAATPAPESIDFGGWLDAKLRERDWSNGLLASKTGVDKSTISRIRRGQRKPTLEIADALGRGLRASFVIGRRPHA